MIRKITRFLATLWQESARFGEPIAPLVRGPLLFLFQPRFRRARAAWLRLQKRFQPRQRWPSVVSVKRARLDNDLSHGISDFHELQPIAHVAIDSNRPFAAYLRDRYPLQTPLLGRQSFVCQLAHPRLHLGEGLVVTRAGAMLMDSAFAPYRLDKSAIYGLPLPASVPFLEGNFTTISGLFDANIYHWLIDAMPRLMSLEMTGREPLTLLLPDFTTPYQRETLAHFLPDFVVPRFLRAPGWFEVEQLTFPSYVSQGGCVSLPKSHTDALRNRIWSRLNLAPDHIGTARIFISRRHAPTRHILNEPELVESLEKHGFQSVELEKLSFEAQVRLFHDAQIVVAPHGAGLTNMLFAPRLQIVELQTTQLSLHYFFLAQSLGHAYASVLSPLRPTPNFLVSIDDVEKTLVPLLGSALYATKAP